MSNSCYRCKHYSRERETESWEMPHIFWYVHICEVRNGVANLKQFPFENTGCTKFEANGVVGTGQNGTGNRAKRAQAGRK